MLPEVLYSMILISRVFQRFAEPREIRPHFVFFVATLSLTGFQVALTTGTTR